MSFADDPKKVASEDEPGVKWDRCVADTILKTGAGAGLGMVLSLLLFKRRPWPVALGTGFGLGYAVSNCQHDFKRVDSLYIRPIKTPEDALANKESSLPKESSPTEQSTSVQDKPKS